MIIMTLLHQKMMVAQTLIKRKASSSTSLVLAQTSLGIIQILQNLNQLRPDVVILDLR